MLKSTTMRLFIAGGLMLTLAIAGPSSAAEEEQPVPLIFDTDIGNDVDDVLALGMIHALQSRGECRLIAVTITKDHELAAPFVDAVNTFYGRGDIPVGVCDSGVTPRRGSFLGMAELRDDGQLRYPHDLGPDNPPAQAITLLRAALAAEEDGTVVIVQVGFSTNLANLLASGPDDASELGGRDLVARKVRLLSIMAGGFTRNADGTGDASNHREFNVVRDIPAAQRVAQDWPTPVVWSGFEVGLALGYPHTSIERDFRYTEHHPLAEAYILYEPPPHNRPTWDLTSVLYAVRPDEGYFGLSQPGQVTVADDGKTAFTPSPDGTHRRLTITPQEKPRTLEALRLLSSEPPASVDQ
ncbi:nucleoside hydrolase [Phycisphaeraceae bacterium D3-23]